MKQFRATQHTAQYGPMALHLRFIGKKIFMKGNQNSTKYVDKMIGDLQKKGAIVQKGNGGWIMIDIIRQHDLVKLGAIEFNPQEAQEKDIETILFDFYYTKYKESQFIVQEVK